MRTLIPYCLAAMALTTSLPSAGASQIDPTEQGREERETNSHQSFVYTVANSAGENAVAAFSRDRRTGQLRYLGRYASGGLGNPAIFAVSQHSIVSDGRRVYAINPGSHDISTFVVLPGGALQLLSVVPSGGKVPVSLALHGDLLYVANFGTPPGTPETESSPANYSGFRLQRDGSPVPLPGSTIQLASGDAPSDIVFNPEGCLLIGTRAGGSIIDSFLVSGSGLLVRADLLRDQPAAFGAAFNPLRPWQLFADYAAPAPGAVAGAVGSFRVDGQGRLERTGAPSDPSLQAPCWIVVSPDGRSLWVSSAFSQALTLFSIGNDGRLSLTSVFAPTDSGLASLDIALDQEGRYLYQLRAFNIADLTQPVTPHLRVLRVTGKTPDAGLALVQDLPLPDDLATAGISGLTIVDR